MRKLRLSFIILMLMITIVSACSNGEDQETEEAMEVGKAFLETLYNEDDTEFDFEDVTVINDITEQYATYLTEDELDELTTTRFLFIPKEIAANNKLTLSIQDIDIELDDEDVSEEVKVTHTFTLLFTDESGEEEREEAIEGQMTIVDTEDGFKIDRYHDTGVPMELLK